MHKGTIGVANLNIELQKRLNPGPSGITRGTWSFRIGDKVMQIVNNYDKDVFNGDIGWISKIDPEEREVVIDFDGRPVPYDYSDLDEVVLAYAVSVHKAQGSEYPVVILPVVTQHYMLLQRNLIYTGITRAKNGLSDRNEKGSGYCHQEQQTPTSIYSSLGEAGSVMSELKNEFSWSKPGKKSLKPVPGSTGFSTTATGTDGL